MPEIQIELPYSKPPLNLNYRMHWRERARITRQVRDAARILTLAKLRWAEPSRIEVELSYQPRDNRRRDVDNLIATLKPVCDGIVDAGLVPDDTPEFMGKRMPKILPAKKGEGGRMFFTIYY